MLEAKKGGRINEEGEEEEEEGEEEDGIQESNEVTMRAPGSRRPSPGKRTSLSAVSTAKLDEAFEEELRQARLALEAGSMVKSSEREEIEAEMEKMSLVSAILAIAHKK